MPNKVITLQQMNSMSIDDIVNLYKDGYTIQDYRTNGHNINNLDIESEAPIVLLLIGAGLLFTLLVAGTNTMGNKIYGAYVKHYEK